MRIPTIENKRLNIQAEQKHWEHFNQQGPAKTEENQPAIKIENNIENSADNNEASH